MTEPLLRVHELRTHFTKDRKVIRSVNGVSFTLEKGETLAIVGESGCGKSVTSLSIMGLIQSPGKVVGGSIELEGVNLLGLSKKGLRKIRGQDMAMIYQEPMASLNPVFRVGEQIAEVYRLHLGARKGQAMEKAVEMLDKVGIPDPAGAARRYPHELSGGMRQRVMIAMALACRPKLLIADEPTTALDVTIQAQILALLRRICREDGTGVILITHDLGVVAGMADRVAVMYAGEIVEEASAQDLFAHPAHPYTAGLLRSIPRLQEVQEELAAIPGSVPSSWDTITGCPFHPRCAMATDVCRQDKPPLRTVGYRRQAACFYAGEGAS